MAGNRAQCHIGVPASVQVGDRTSRGAYPAIIAVEISLLNRVPVRRRVIDRLLSPSRAIPAAMRSIESVEEPADG